jgi:hypothetical protein
MSSAMVPPRLKEVLAAFHMETDQMKVRQLEALDSEENRPIPVPVQAMTCRALHDLVRWVEETGLDPETPVILPRSLNN